LALLESLGGKVKGGRRGKTMESIGDVIGGGNKRPSPESNSPIDGGSASKKTRDKRHVFTPLEKEILVTLH
jgi:hypothetical protein